MRTKMFVKCASIALLMMGIVLITPANAKAQTSNTSAPQTEVKDKGNSDTKTETKSKSKTHKGGHKGSHHKKSATPAS